MGGKHNMEKILRVVSSHGLRKIEDGLDEVNRYLEEGWKVKHISSCAMGEFAGGQAYIVIEKEDK